MTTTPFKTFWNKFRCSEILNTPLGWILSNVRSSGPAGQAIRHWFFSGNNSRFDRMRSPLTLNTCMDPTPQKLRTPKESFKVCLPWLTNTSQTRSLRNRALRSCGPVRRRTWASRVKFSATKTAIATFSLHLFPLGKRSAPVHWRQTFPQMSWLKLRGESPVNSIGNDLFCKVKHEI